MRRLVPSFCLLLALAPVAHAEPCPVTPHREADAAFTAPFAGRVVRFCCAECVGRFRANPTPYLGRLPKPPPSERLVDRIGHNPEAAALAGALLLTLPIVALLRRFGPYRRVRRATIRPVWWGWLAAAALGGGLWYERGRAVEQARQEGRDSAPPVPLAVPPAELLNWSWPQGLHQLPQGTRTTYYRGNDERSDQLAFGGRYRTATFDVALVRADGTPVEPGADCPDAELSVRLDVRRAANTADDFFRPEAMAKLFGARLDAPAQEAKRALVVTPGWHWRIDFPLEPAPADESVKRRGVGVIGVGPKPRYGAPGTQAHYYVQWALHFDGGRLSPVSAVWMGPVLLSPFLNEPNSDAEWFSDRPIPENPKPPATDPKLLGVPD